MDNRPSLLWALAPGVLFPILQVVIDLVRIGGLNPEATLFDYLMLVLAGTLIGAGLVYFLHRSKTRGASWAVIIAFVISLPFALFGMVLGGMVGLAGILLLSVSPALFITGIGFFIGRAFSKR